MADASGAYVFRGLGPLGAEPWGAETVEFEVAGIPFRLSGLNAFQAGWLRQRYAEVDAASGAIEIRCRQSSPDLFASEFEPGHAFDLELTPAIGALWLDGPRFRACLPVVATASTQGIQAEAGPVELWTPEGEGEWLEGVFANLLRVGLAVAAVPRGAILLHSTGFLIDGPRSLGAGSTRAILGFGPSGTGKSTLGRHALAAGTRVLSDDLNLIHPGEQGYRAHAVPYAGELGSEPGYEFAAGGWPLAAVVRLRQGQEIHLRRLPSRAAALANLLASAPFVNVDEQLRPPLEDNLERLLASVPALELTLPRDADFQHICRCLHQELS